MLRNVLNPDPSANNSNQYTAEENRERFESDTQKIVRRHLQDKDHVITEEEIASIRIGGTQSENENQ